MGLIVAAALAAGGCLALAVDASSDSPPLLVTNSPVVWTAFVALGQHGTAQPAVLTNGGGGTLSITSIHIGGVDPQDFPVTSDGCTGAALGAGQSCKVFVQFTPTATGTRVATMIIGDTRGSCVNYVTLAGGGTPSPIASSADCAVPVPGATTTVSSTTTTSTTPSNGVQGFSVSSAQCTSKRKIIVHLQVPRNVRVVSAKLYVNGALSATVTGHAVTAVTVNLSGKPLGRYSIRVVARSARGNTMTTSRFFVTCVPKS
jgi:hypothetical protein